MVAEGSSTSEQQQPPPPPQHQQPQQNALPAPSSPSSVIRRKMASQAPAKKDAVPPRRSAVGAAASARRPAAASTNTASSASKPLASSTTTSRLAGTGSSLNKPPTRAPVSTAGRRTASSTLSPASTPSAATKRPSTTSRPSAENAPSRSTPRSTPRTSLASSAATATAAKPAPTRPTVSTRTPHHIIPKAPVSTITPKTPVAHAKKPSITSVPSPSKTAPAESLTHSPIDVPARSYGPLKDKAASDAEVEVKKSIPFGPLKDSLPKVGEEGRRPGTAPSGSAEANDDSNCRGLSVMQEFFKETTLREKLQEQCNDLIREVDSLQTTNTKLKKQLVDVQSAVAEKDKAITAAGTDATGWDENKHNTIVNGMEKRFALETKLLEEQKQKLKEEKRVAQEKEAAESAKAAELQQVLDDLNVELERQGREWDAEKLQLVEQGAKLELLTKEVSVLREERDALSTDLTSASSTLVSLQTKLTTIQKTQSDELEERDEKIDSLAKTVEALQSDVVAAEQRSKDVSDEAKHSLDSSASESNKLVEELQAKVNSLEQKHTDELREKDEAIAMHVQIENEMRSDLAKLQERANQSTANLESERTAHAENLKAKIAEMQEDSQTALKTQEANIAGHLKSIEDLQAQISTLEQGETDEAQVSEELTKQMEDLQRAHEETIRLKTEQNEELVRQLEAINDQLSSDGSEINRLKEEADSLRKTVEAVEQAAERDGSMHTAALTHVQEELAQVKIKADSYKVDLEAAQDRHRQDLRVLGEDHDAEIDSLRADLEGDAKKRLDKLQAEYDALVAEKTAALEVHEKSLANRTAELEEARVEMITLKESSGSTSQGLDDAIAKHKQISEEKVALAEALSTAQEQVSSLETQIVALTKENSLIAELEARIDAMTEDSQASSEALATSEKSFTDLKAKLDVLAVDKQALEDQQAEIREALTKTQAELRIAEQEKQDVIASRGSLENEAEHLAARYDSLMHEKSAMEESHARTIDALKQDSADTTKQTLSELQLKYDTLLEEKTTADNAHAEELGKLRGDRDLLASQLAAVENKLADAITARKTEVDAQAEGLDIALQSQRQEVEQKYAALLEEVQADCNKLEQEIGKAITERESALTDLDALKANMQAEIDDLRHELQEKEELDSAGLAEVSKKYETLLIEQSAADKEAHQAAIEELAQTLRAEYERAKQEAYSELEHLKDQLDSEGKSNLAAMNEVRVQYETLLAEQSAADKRDHETTLALLRESAATDLTEIKERFKAVSVERDSLKDELHRAREFHAEVDELRRDLGIVTKSSHAKLDEAMRKYDSLLAEKTAAVEAHERAVSSLKESFEREREHTVADLQSRYHLLQEKFAKIEEQHQQTLAQMQRELEDVQNSDADELRQQLELVGKGHTEATEKMVEAHENALSDLMASMQKCTTDAVQKVQQEYAVLEARHVEEKDALRRDGDQQRSLHSELQARLDKAITDREAAAENIKRLQNAIELIEAERDRAYKTVTEAEDRIETFKGEVVRKHLARVEPLQKENTALLNKIDRLQDMLAAGDRIARAAASLSEKREMTALAEESEEGEGSASSVEPDTQARGAPRPAHLPNGAAKDVVGTQLAAMQETLSQLNALNNDIITESEKTAERLTERD